MYEPQTKRVNNNLMSQMEVESGWTEEELRIVS
jgi:hypothetical protein